MVGLSDHLFAYGSLVAELGARGAAARLPGYRRIWGVAADNRRALPGYKQFRLRDDGSTPAVYVAFLDIVEDDQYVVEGVVVPVERAELEQLDLRERNYDRVDVSALVDPPSAERVWTYVGSPAGRARLTEGVRSNAVVISRDYAAAVEAALLALGAAGLDGMTPVTEGLPVLDLERVDLPISPSGSGRAAR